MKLSGVFFAVFALFCGYGFSQVDENRVPEPENLQKQAYKTLEESFKSNEKDSARAWVYANAYTLKAKRENNNVRTAEGYDMLWGLCPALSISKLRYADSIIRITKDLDHFVYPGRGYLMKGRYYYDTGDYKTAFENKLIALDYASAQNNIKQILEVKHFLAVIKKRLGEDKEALPLFREYLYFIEEQNTAGQYIRDNILAYLSISDSYRRNKKPDSAIMMAKKGIAMSLRNDNKFYGIFLLSAGMIHFDAGDYTQAIDSLNKAVTLLEASKSQKTNLAYSYLYLGKSHEQLKSPATAIDYFKKVDSVLTKYPKVVFEFRESYEYLIGHYKATDDKDLQLYYVERLLHIDSILDSNYKYLSKNIVQKYDTPMLMAEKKALIDVLYKKNRLSFSGIIVLGVLLLTVFFFAWHYYRKQRFLKERFNEIMNSTKTSANMVATKEKQHEDLGIPEEIAKNILDGLSKFIKKEEYLNQQINLHTLAKKLRTNPKYLSKTINFYEQKSFTSYINDLRINYAIERLKTDTMLRRYAVKAIASEIGFKNQQSFSQAFHKKTGMHPSYFIKQLQKHSA